TANISLPVRFGETPASEIYDSGLMRVLIVEDDAAMGMTMREVLGGSGFGSSIVLVQSGNAALKEFERNCYDVVILDGRLPDMSGIRLTKQLRAQERAQGRAATVIIGFTGDDDPELQQALQDAGADGMIPKMRGIKALADQIARIASLPTLGDSSKVQSA